MVVTMHITHVMAGEPWRRAIRRVVDLHLRRQFFEPFWDLGIQCCHLGVRGPVFLVLDLLVSVVDVSNVAYGAG